MLTSNRIKVANSKTNGEKDIVTLTEVGEGFALQAVGENY